MSPAMRVCPTCQSVHSDETEFCPADGSELVDLDPDFEVAATASGEIAGVDPSRPPTGEPESGGAARIPSTQLTAPQDEPGTNLIGQVVGGVYRVVELIGAGGMGEVYRVEHVNLKKEFALKVLGKVAQDHPEAVERFRQEAVTASRIEHDNIVDIITLDATTDGHLYIVMEILRGQSLAEAMEEARGMPAERALPIVYQICRALHAAHEEGIIHRDLKPENVFLTRKGDAEFVKILDFGISKIHAAESDRVRITKTGQFLGTPLYMSPEQARGEPNLDRRVDIYALGVMLYEMLEGSPPFEGENYFQLIWKHSNETVPPMKRDAPDRLKTVILRTLSKEPAHRYATMLDLEEAIVEAVPEVPPPPFLLDFRPSQLSRPPSALPPGSQRRPSTLTWALAALLGGVVAVVLVLALNPGSERGDATAGLPPPVAVPDASVAVSDASPTAPAKTADAAPLESGAAEAGESSLKVRLNVSTEPGGAQVMLGGEELGVTPLEIERLPSSDEVELRVLRPGYRPVVRQVTLDHDITLELNLTKHPRSTPPRNTTGLPIKKVL